MANVKFNLNDLSWLAAALESAIDNTPVIEEYEQYERLLDKITDILEK